MLFLFSANLKIPFFAQVFMQVKNTEIAYFFNRLSYFL